MRIVVLGLLLVLLLPGPVGDVEAAPKECQLNGIEPMQILCDCLGISCLAWKEKVQNALP